MQLPGSPSTLSMTRSISNVITINGQPLSKLVSILTLAKLIYFSLAPENHVLLNDFGNDLLGHIATMSF